MAAMADNLPMKKPTAADSAQDVEPLFGRRHRVPLSILALILTAYLIYDVLLSLDEEHVARFSVHVAAVDGLIMPMNSNATAAGRTVVSPALTLAVRVENPRAWKDWRCAGGGAVVSYDGVSLAWARVPAFRVPRKGAAEMTVAASGKGVGLSEELRRRLLAEWSAGEARVVAEMKLVYDGNGWPGRYAYDGVSLVRRELELPGHGTPDA